jgi:hypothetical protein
LIYFSIIYFIEEVIGAHSSTIIRVLADTMVVVIIAFEHSSSVIASTFVIAASIIAFVVIALESTMHSSTLACLATVKEGTIAAVSIAVVKVLITRSTVEAAAISYWEAFSMARGFIREPFKEVVLSFAVGP